MTEGDASVKSERLVSDVQEMRLKGEDDDGDVDMDTIPATAEAKKERDMSRTSSAASTPGPNKLRSLSPTKDESSLQSPAAQADTEVVGGEVELKLEPGQAPKLTRKASHKVERRPPPLFFDYDDKTSEATSTFTLLSECVYANKYMGTTEHALECDCAEEWDASTRSNQACGDDSDCINRATKMECVGDCGCGSDCQNRRFQNKEWSDVTVIKTEKKGYGLRADKSLKPNDFIFEYIGEVIGENAFRKRMQIYDEEGIKHFYFMSLNKGEFVDATKRGNLGRFCNHSCNPNCYVDKWVVGDKLRMGIFAERKIRAGEELVFNYNVDRYGADPQPCYCGEPNCTGYIGGKTQTERATKLSNTLIEALGIDDADAWDTAVAKRPKKKKVDEDDEEYVNNVEPRGLDEDGVNKVMSSLMQCKEKWIAVKLLARIQRAGDEKVRNRVVRFHGYRILKTVLSNFMDDINVCLQILNVLDIMPRLTRNKIQDSGIEETVTQLADNEDERVVAQSKRLLESWSKLEMGYRIPRMKREKNSAVPDRKIDRADRRDGERRRSKSRTPSPQRLKAPKGPRNSGPERPAVYQKPRTQPRFRPPPPGPLPKGWFETTAQNGSVYYYNSAGTTTWQRPTVPAAPAPPPPPKAQTDQQMLQDLIKSIVETKKEPGKSAPSSTATPTEKSKTQRKEDKLRALPEEKQKKIYEGALQPHIMHVVGKYKHKLAKDDLKRWAKELAKKIVDSDFKKGRVHDPSKVGDSQVKSVKKHAQEFFEKAMKKKELAEKRKAEKRSKQPEGESQTPAMSPPPVASPVDKNVEMPDLSDDEVDQPEATPADTQTSSPSALKRGYEDLVDGSQEDESHKKQRIEDGDESVVTAPPPPPPPPPPPIDPEQTDTEQRDLAPDEDVSSSFTHEAITDAHEATLERSWDENVTGTKEMDQSPRAGLQRKDELMQMATPPTTGSPDVDLDDDADKTAKEEQTFTGADADSIRQLGIVDGASE